MTSALTIELSKHSLHRSFSSLNDILTIVNQSKILVLYAKITYTPFRSFEESYLLSVR